MFLEELEHPVTQLRGVGPAMKQALANLGISSISDLLRHLPRDYADRSRIVPLLRGRTGEAVNTAAVVRAHEFVGRPPKRILKIIVQDETDVADLVCFGRPFLGGQFPVGARVRVAGRFQLRYGRLQTGSFDLAIEGAQDEDFSSILPIYPLSGRLTQKSIRRLVRQAVTGFGRKLVDDVRTARLMNTGDLSLPAAVERVHFPSTIEEAEKARRRLAMDELVHFQLALLLRGAERRRTRRTPEAYPRSLQQGFLANLPFRLTEGQAAAVEDLYRDACGPLPGARLLQGDVGSGKTLVALAAALPYIEKGRQVAFLAPTELLSRQHAETAARHLEPLGVRPAFFAGTVTGRARGILRAELAGGRIDLVVGTHALFSDDLDYRDLGFVIIDEQHRFGVAQRARLAAKGRHPDVVLMSATPIPRTLALSVLGDLDVSTIATSPPGRLPVETHLAALGKEAKVYEWVRRQLAEGRQAYFVYPAIDEGEDVDLRTATDMYRGLTGDVFPGIPASMIHSRLPEEEKRRAMDDFASGKTRILVATSVVEVGVDVPNATCMVVEHADRFGLAALHQLRGRVGRGLHPSFAFFVYDPDLSEVAKRRLRILKETSDGFRIAEEDMSLRGPGDIRGLRQAGILEFSFARLPADLDLLEAAGTVSREILAADPNLSAPDNEGLRCRLALQGSFGP